MIFIMIIEIQAFWYYIEAYKMYKTSLLSTSN